MNLKEKKSENRTQVPYFSLFLFSPLMIVMW